MKASLFTLGCKVNTYESNVMADMLINAGYIIVNSKDQADICIINTCTVTNTADNKSAKAIRQIIRNNPNSIIIVVGCFSQIKPDIVASILGVSIVLGNKYKSKIIDLIEEFKQTNKQIIKVENIMDTDFECMKLNNFDRTRAFVKIEDGCNNFCSYCIIPYSRGNVRSKDKDDVLDEVLNLVRNGHSEIVLTGIHTGHYGEDLDNYNFYNLLCDLLKIPGLERLRISSIELNEITDEIINLMKNNHILVDHMHIPLQSGTDKILKLMNRKYDVAYFTSRINKIREVRPEISITTDVIVGFPGELEEDFVNTINNIKTINFSKIHVFPYSDRANTVASTLENHLSEETKKSRSRQLVKLSKELEMKYMNQFIDKVVEFIPETIKEGFLIGHTGNYLLIKTNGKTKHLHKSIRVKIIKNDYPYLIADTVNE